MNKEKPTIEIDGRTISLDEMFCYVNKDGTLILHLQNRETLPIPADKKDEFEEFFRTHKLQSLGDK
jgi:hypothetical protein